VVEKLTTSECVLFSMFAVELNDANVQQPLFGLCLYLWRKDYLWQTNTVDQSCLIFLSVLWPDFSVLLFAITFG